MPVGRREQEMHEQAGAPTEQGMDAITVQQGARMVCGSVTSSSIGIRSAPGQNGSTVENQIASSKSVSAHCFRYNMKKSSCLLIVYRLVLRLPDLPIVIFLDVTLTKSPMFSNAEPWYFTFLS